MAGGDRILQTRGAATAAGHDPRSGADRVRAEQVETLFKNVAPGVIGAAVGGILLEIVLFRLGATDDFAALGWFAAIDACVLAHLCLLYLYRRTAKGERWWPWASVFTLIALGEGCMWGWASLYIDQSHRADVQLLIMCVILVAATAAIPAFGSYLPSFLAFFLPASLPFAIAAWGARQPVIAQAAILMPIFVATMLALGIQTARNFKELVELRLKAAELAEHLQAQIEVAERANREKSSFLAAASHDLRQPVHAIGMLVGALRSTSLPSKALQLTEKLALTGSSLDWPEFLPLHSGRLPLLRTIHVPCVPPPLPRWDREVRVSLARFPPGVGLPRY